MSKITGALGTVAGVILAPFVKLWVWFQSSQNRRLDKAADDARTPCFRHGRVISQEKAGGQSK